MHKNASCSYVASRRGGPRNCQNRRRRKASVSVPAPAPTPATIIDLPANSDTTDTEERRSQPSSTFDTSIAQTSGEGSSSTGDVDWFDQLIDLSAPGAGLRSVDMPIAEMELIFDSIFDKDQGNGSDVGVVQNDEASVVDMVQLYGSHDDM